MSNRQFDIETIIGFHYQWRDSVDFARVLASTKLRRTAVKKRNGFWFYGFSSRKARHQPARERPYE